MWIKFQVSFHMDELVILKIQTSFHSNAAHSFLKGLLRNSSSIRSFFQHEYGFHLDIDRSLFGSHSTNLLWVVLPRFIVCQRAPNFSSNFFLVDLQERDLAYLSDRSP